MQVVVTQPDMQAGSPCTVVEVVGPAATVLALPQQIPEGIVFSEVVAAAVVRTAAQAATPARRCVGAMGQPVRLTPMPHQPALSPVVDQVERKPATVAQAAQVAAA